MKELSIEEKAKRYDEAIKKAESLYKVAEPMGGCNVIIETLFPELKESEDERIRKALIELLNDLWAEKQGLMTDRKDYERYIAWLEKQGEHANFRNKIQIGDKVTKNRDGYLINLSQLNRVAKVEEKQGEQKPQRMISAGAKEAMYDKPAWSEEDEDRLNSCIDAINAVYKWDSMIAWLKSLRPQSQWKPSEEQIEILDMVLTNETMDDNIIRILRELREQLKKLR